MGEVYDLVNTAKAKFPGSRLVLSGVLRSKRVNWRRVGAANDRLEWVAENPGATFVDPNSWVDDWDFSRDGLHLTFKRRIKSRLPFVGIIRSSQYSPRFQVKG